LQEHRLAYKPGVRTTKAVNPDAPRLLALQAQGSTIGHKFPIDHATIEDYDEN
jgi:hypothetical protein